MTPRETRYYADTTHCIGQFGCTSSRPVVVIDTLYVPNAGTLRGDFKSPNSFSFSRGVTSNLEGVYQEFDRVGGEDLQRQSWVGVIPFSVGFSGDQAYPDFNNLFNDALSQLNDQYRGSVDWTTNLAQMGQTRSMVSKAMSTLSHVRRSVSKLDLWGAYLAYKRIRRDPHRTFQRSVREAGNRWLEFQYGWKPLAQDLYDTAVQLGRDFPSLMKCEARAVHTQKDIQSTNLNGVPRMNIRDLSRRVQIKCRFRPSSATANLLSNFTTLNPATVAWELTPYSFVVDWFVDVGGYMRNLESSLLAGGSFVDGFYTESQRNDVLSFVNGTYRTPGTDVLVVCNAKGTNYYSILNRNRLDSWPLPRVPTFKADLGSGRLLNAAALIAKEMRIKR